MIRFVVASAVLTAGASAQSFTYSIDPAQSDISVNSSITLDLTGDLKGVFDAEVKKRGGKFLRSIPRRPQTHGDAEWWHKELGNGVRRLLLHARAPYQLWSFAARHFGWARSRRPDGRADGRARIGRRGRLYE